MSVEWKTLHDRLKLILWVSDAHGLKKQVLDHSRASTEKIRKRSVSQSWILLDPPKNVMVLEVFLVLFLPSWAK
jgi:hypothetical protein